MKQAQELIESVGLTFKDGGEMDSEKTKGTVVKSDPPSGENTAVGAEITVYSSNQTLIPGPGTTVGLALAQARAALATWTIREVIPENCSYQPQPTPTANPTPTPVPTPCAPVDPTTARIVAQDIVGGFIKPGATITISVQR